MIAEGEVLQLTAAASLATDEAIYLQVIRGKTAALFAAATEVGGGDRRRAGGAGRGAARPTATRSGSSFQIADDLLDYGGLSATLGKNVGDDFRERKMSLPVIRAVGRRPTTEERAFWRRVIEKGEQGDGRPRARDLDHAPARQPRQHAGDGAVSRRPRARSAGAAAGRTAGAWPERPRGLRGGADRLRRRRTGRGGLCKTVNS